MNLALWSPPLRRIGVVALAAVLIAGCSSTGSSAAPSAAAPSAATGSTAPAPSGEASPSAAAVASFAPISMTVVEDYPAPHWIAQVPWWMAKEKGFYSDLGLDVNFQLPPTPPDPAKFIATGKVDMGISYTPDLLTAASQGLDFVAVGSLMDRNTEGIMCWKDSGVTTPKDLEGKTVAIYDFPMAQLNWDLFLKHWGVDPTKVKKVSEGNYGVPLIVSGKADCIDAAAPMELQDAQLQAKKDAIFFLYDETQGIPNFYWFVLAANRAFADKNPEAVRRFTEATLKGFQYAKDHPDEVQTLFKKIAPDQDPVMAAKAWESLAGIEYNADGTLNRFYPTDPPGFMRPELWSSFQDILVANGLQESKVDVNKFVSNDYLPK